MKAFFREPNQLMARDETGMNVVLIDTAKRLEELHRVYPGLAKAFLNALELLTVSKQKKQKNSLLKRQSL